MTASAAQIAAYLDKRFADLPRDHTPLRFARSNEPMLAPRPSRDDLARQLYSEAEFLALKLGDFVGTDRGELIAEGVERVSPPFYRADERLIVDALTEGARLQAQGKQIGGALAIAGAGFFAWLIVTVVRQAATSPVT